MDQPLATFTIAAFTENHTGLLARVVSIFTRRHVNIESLTTSRSSVADIHRFTIVVRTTEEKVHHLVMQLEKQVDVLKAFSYRAEEIVYQEIALYKVPTRIFNDGRAVEDLIRRHNARILLIEPEYVIIEKTGHEFETERLLEELQEWGIYEFVRSGRVAIPKPMEQLNRYLQSLGREEQVVNND